MTAYAFRFINDDGKPTGHIGVAFAQSLDDLYWTIDEFGDPNSIEIADVKNAGMCVKVDCTGDVEQDDIDLVFTENELTEQIANTFYFQADYKWRKPSWAGVTP